MLAKLRLVMQPEGITFPIMVVSILVLVLAVIGYQVKARHDVDSFRYVKKEEKQLAEAMRIAVFRRGVIVRDLAILTDNESMKLEFDDFSEQDRLYRQSERKLMQMFQLPGTLSAEKALLDKVRQEEASLSPLLQQAIKLGLANRNDEAGKMIFFSVLPAQKRLVKALNELIETEEKLRERQVEDLG